MAQLFSWWTLKSTIETKGFIEQFTHNAFDEKIAIISDIYNDYKNSLLDDEVKYKEKFNQVFFWELLWYTNRIHRIPEWHIKWVGNADLVLWNFVDGKEDAESIQIVCELKGAKSNLVKKQYGHWWLSPVGQWFSYKTWLKNCKWLIVSNFFEIRLYRDNQTDFEVWNLEMLLDPKDDYFNLKSLYLLLHKDNLLANTWTSKTEDLLSHFRDEQLAITKSFYREYKELRLALLQDVKKRNSSLSVNTLVEKTQKIIDRLIFIFFCEDRGLLPDKKLKEWIERAGEFDITPREMTKRFFRWVDQGSEKLGIPDGYNGGLFKDDAILNSLHIWDDICKAFVELTNYDFQDDLSVNVLWHIFEQSISDLEEIKEDLIGKESKVLQASKWRRKKDGIFYTPEYIVDYIIQNSVMKYLSEKEDECLKKYQKKKNWEILAYQEYQYLLQNIKVLDPACGSGAFLVRVFDVLFEENKRVGSILNSLFDDTETYKNILTNNIYGVDLNDESVEITKLSLWLKSAQKGKKLNNLDANIKCGNSLIDDPAIAGEKAFDWNKEFPEVFFSPSDGWKSNFRVSSTPTRKAGHPSKRGSSRSGDNIKPDWMERSLFPFWTLPKNKILTQRARDLRKQGILSEVIFWKTFKHKKYTAGYDIDRQIVIGNFIVDFFIAELGLVIEIDGSSHDDKQEYDTERQNFLESLHLEVIRYTDAEIKNNLDSVARDFLEKIEKREAYLKNNLEHVLPTSQNEISLKEHNTPPHSPFEGWTCEEWARTGWNTTEREYMWGFDVIVGNPPYVNIANISNEQERKYLQLTYQTVKNKSDLYSIFVEKTVSLLKENGSFWMIFPDTWLSTDSFSEFRRFLLKNTEISHIVDLPYWIFDDAVVKTLMLFLNKKSIEKGIIQIIKFLNWTFEQQKYYLEYSELLQDEWYKINLNKQIKFQGIFIKLWNVGKLSLWIKTSDDKRFLSNEIIDENSYKIIRWRDILRYFFQYNWEYVWYRPDLMMEKKWAWPRNLEDFLKEKLLFKEIGKTIQCTYDNSWILCNDTVNILFDINRQYNIKFLMVVLNSKCINFWYKSNFSTWLHMKINQLNQIPIPKTISFEDQQPFIEKAEQMLEMNKKFNEKKDIILTFLQQKYGLEKISKKLQKFYELDFKEFLKQLKVKNISMTEERELMQLFEKDKTEMLELKHKIDSTDREIDDMVFDLYGLTDEERSIVLAG